MDTRATIPKSAYDEAIAAILRARMAELRLSRSELSERSGLSPETFRRYLDGTRSVPVANFVALVLALDLEPGHVIEDARARVASITGD